MQVFVTVGTTRFDALIATLDDEKCVEALVKRGFDRMLLQIGHGDHLPQTKFDQFPDFEIAYYRHSPLYKEDVAAADLVISHAGAGSIMDAMSLQKKLVVVVNTALMDNHQTELAQAMANGKYCVATDCDGLLQVLQTGDWQSLQSYPQPDETAFPRLLDQVMGIQHQE